MKIYKQLLELGTQTIELPLYAKIITVHEQFAQLTMWYIFNEESTITEKRTFSVIGTGHIIPEGSEYIGTIHQEQYVWHVFEHKQVSAVGNL